MLEILAPAGNAECAKAAIDSGANAIYLGYSAFSARQSAEDAVVESAILLFEGMKQLLHFLALSSFVCGAG